MKVDKRQFISNTLTVVDDTRGYINTFRSIAELRRTIKERPINSAIFPSLSSETGSRDFTGTGNFKEAEKLIGSGWTLGRDQLVESIKTVNIGENIVYNKHLPIHDVVGHSPDVPRAIIGLPDAMMDTEIIPQKAKVINAIVSNSASWNYSTESIMQRGAAILKYIQEIEKNQVRICIWVVTSTVHDNEWVSCYTKVKRAEEPINLRRIAFPIAHPSMLRRIFFRVLETTPVTTRGWNYGYGRPNDAASILAIPKNITNPIFFPSLNEIPETRSGKEYILKVIKYNKDKVRPIIEKQNGAKKKCTTKGNP